MKPLSLLPPLPVICWARLQKLPSLLPSAWGWVGLLLSRRKRVLALLKGVLGFLLLALVYEARQQKGNVGHWALSGAKRVGWVFKWRLREWLAYWRVLRFQRKHAYLNGHLFLSAELAGDDAATAAARTASDKPFTRHVMLGDRGRARCSWALRQQYQSHVYCDVTFLVDGRAFPAHRCWVAAFSQPLGAMFRSGMKESQESRIMLRDTDAGAFQLMLDFIYGGPVELNQDNIECVLELSVRFAVGVLIEQCCNFLASAVAVDTACAILILADKYNCRPLRRDTLLFVVAHLPRCWATAREHFARLPKALLVEVLAHDALVHGEIVAFHAAVFWLEERRRLLAGGGGGDETGVGVVEEDDEASLVEQVLAHVRFPHMPARLLVEEVESHPIMQREACKRFVLEAYRYQAVLLRNSSSTAAYHEQQEVLQEYAEEMGDRARPRRLPAHAAHRRLALLPPAGEEDDNDDAGQHELLLSSSASAPPPTAAMSSGSSCSGGVTTVTTHQLVGPAEAVEPPSLLQQLHHQQHQHPAASRGASIATVASAIASTSSSSSSSSSNNSTSGGGSATSSMLQYALITTVERHKGDGGM